MYMGSLIETGNTDRLTRSLPFFERRKLNRPEIYR